MCHTLYVYWIYDQIMYVHYTHIVCILYTQCNCHQTVYELIMINQLLRSCHETIVLKGKKKKTKDQIEKCDNIITFRIIINNHSNSFTDILFEWHSDHCHHFFFIFQELSFSSAVTSFELKIMADVERICSNLTSNSLIIERLTLKSIKIQNANISCISDCCSGINGHFICYSFGPRPNIIRIENYSKNSCCTY